MSDERLFDPTPQRLAQARREGHVARSASLTTVIVLLAAATCLWWYGGHLMQSLGWFLRVQLSDGVQIGVSSGSLVKLQSAHAVWLARLLLPWLGCVVGAAVAANLIQGGFVWAPQRIAPDFARLAVGRRLAAMFSIGRVLDVLIELAKLSTCLGVAGWGLWRHRDQLSLGPLALTESVSGVMQILLLVLFQSLLTLGAISLLEYFLTLWRHRQSMRMTAEEWREELQERESAVNVQQTRRFADSASAASDRPDESR